MAPSAAGGLEQVLNDLGTRYVTMLVSHDGLAVYRALVSEARHLPGLADAFFEKGPQRVHDALVAIFEAHNRQGEAKIGHPSDAAEQFTGMLRSNLHLAALARDEIPSPERIAHLVEGAARTLLKGVLEAPRALGTRQHPCA